MKLVEIGQGKFVNAELVKYLELHSSVSGFFIEFIFDKSNSVASKYFETKEKAREWVMESFKNS